MKNLIIIGAGGFGREVLSYALEIQTKILGWRVKGFIDDNLDALINCNISEYKVIDKIRKYKIHKEDVFVCAIGNPKIKLEIGRTMQEKGAEFINLIHPKARIGERTVIGIGLVMAPNSNISTDCTIGDFVAINFFSGCGHDVTIEDGCTISSFCDVTGGAVLQEGVFLGSHVTICPRSNVGKFATVGAGSVVLKKVDNNVVVFGNPAKRIM